MNNIENILISFNNLKTNKTRTFLTMLGIIIGVMVIILLMSVIFGTQQEIISDIKSMGSNVIIIIPGNIEKLHGPPDLFSINKLKLRHVNIIEKCSSFNAKVSPVSIIKGIPIKYKKEKRNTTIVMGTSVNFPNVRNWNLAEGKFFNNKDVESNKKLAVVGKIIVEDLYKNTNPIGKKINVGDKKLTIIGVLQEKGMFMGQNMDDCIVIPITTAQDILGFSTINRMLVKIPNSCDVENAIIEIKKILSKEMDKKDFTVKSQSELLNMVNTFANVLNIVMSFIASISLFVGGIGIMNIMIVVVKERTKEIGIRKAIGATFHNILFQFITESAIISITGGLIGIILSMAIILFIAPFISFPLKISFNSVILGFSFSVIIGIFFGTYPAIKAAKTDPIVALRHE
ncbi:MAG: ABC transporter permease [bacterium]